MADIWKLRYEHDFMRVEGVGYLRQARLAVAGEQDS